MKVKQVSLSSLTQLTSPESKTNDFNRTSQFISATALPSQESANDDISLNVRTKSILIGKVIYGIT